ncbi:MAG: hypothetical protein LAP38_18375 [Acidobacteriia bacterium]|nr:hypothetical protein [Terriglobia bacterium]
MLRAITIFGLLTLPAWSDSAPIRETSAAAFVTKEMPGFYNGYLFSCTAGGVVTLFAPDGRNLTLVPQNRPDTYVQALFVAVDSDGTLAISWDSRSHAGIDLRDSSGVLLRSIDTGRYIPAHLSFGEDHSLWSFGWQRDAVKQGFPDKQDYATVRKYSSDGKETAAFLPRSLFPRGLEPGTDHWQSRSITVTSDRIGIHAVSGTVSNQREWVELDLDGHLTGRWKLDPSDQFPGVVLTSDNQAYVHRYDREAKSRRVFRLNRALSTWEPVSAPDAALYGTDGDKLVFARWSDGLMHLSWFAQPLELTSPPAP